MPTFSYKPQFGSLYARSFALYENLPPEQRLFYYAEGENCTNFISQCVWAAYGGWAPGFSDSTVKTNLTRILADTRQVKGLWYGSHNNIGSNRWCRVEEFYRYVTEPKQKGPAARKVAEGEWGSVDPRAINQGDVIQLVVTSYTPDRYGHGLYVTRAGESYDDITICCNTDDRLDEPLGWFAQFPEIYSRLRLLRFSDAVFDV